MKKIFFLVSSIFVLIILTAAGCSQTPGTNQEKIKKDDKKEEKVGQNGKVDDWKFAYKETNEEGGLNLGLKAGAATGLGGGSYGMPQAAQSASIGLAVGGAKDVNNFRENIKNNYLPLPTDVTYEGLFYDYFFDTGKTQECTKLFCPSYSQAVSPDPFSKKDEYYLTVGLNSGMKEADFKRKKLNLVVVLDISGSMGSPFSEYYYDQFGNRQENGDKGSEAENKKTKIQIASQSIVSMLGHLKDDDRFGMVLFDDNSYLAKSLSLVGDTDMKKIQDHILELKEEGGTNLEAGMKEGTALFSELKGANPEEYENRIIFLTDAMPNLGNTSDTGLFSLVKQNADNKIYSTFIGIGVDFNTELVDALTKIRGANYYSVHSSTEFSKRMDEEFEYMVTPLVFNLVLSLESKGYQIEQVYGSPEANLATGEIMKVNTLFPSKTENGQTKGGVVLLKLKKISEGGDLVIKTSYEDRSGKTDADQVVVPVMNQTVEAYGNSGIHKAILLARYTNLLKDWMMDARAHLKKPTWDIGYYRTEGIILPPQLEFRLSKWERQSVPLSVSPEYRALFRSFENYFIAENKIVNDSNLDKEKEVLKNLYSKM